MLRLAFTVNAMLNLSIFSKSRRKHVLKHVAQAKFMHRLVSPAALISDWAALRRGRARAGLQVYIRDGKLIRGMNCWVVTCFHPPNWHFPLSGSHKTFHFSYKKFLCPLKFRCSNKSLGVYWRLVKIFASATSRTTSVWHDFLRLVAATKFCCGDNDFQKKLSSTHEAICRLTVLLQLVARPVHMEWSVAATSCCNVCNLSPSVYRPLRTRKWSRPSGSPG